MSDQCCEVQEEAAAKAAEAKAAMEETKRAAAQALSDKTAREAAEKVQVGLHFVSP